MKDEELTPEQLRKRKGMALPADHWLFDYYFSIGFYTLTKYSLVTITKGPYDEAIQ